MVETTKKLKSVHVFTFAFGAMIGWSWIFLTGAWIERAGTIGSLLAIFGGGMLMLIIAMVYAELAAMFPKNGGEHVYTMEAFGPKISFICSWALLLGYMGVIAFEAVVFPFILAHLFPTLNIGYLWTFDGLDVYFGQVAIGIGTALCITKINVKGISLSARLQIFASALIFTAFFLLLSGAAQSEASYALLNIRDSLNFGVFSVLIMLPMMFVGFDVIAQTANEIDLHPRLIGRLIIVSVTAAMLFYATAVFCVGLVLGDSASLEEFPTAHAAALGWDGREGVRYLIIIGGIAGILTSWNGFLVGASRLVFEMSKDGQLPRWFVGGSPSRNSFSPDRVLWTLCAISCLAPWFGRSVLVWLVDAGSFGIVVAYFFVVLAFIKLRITRPNAPRPYKLPYGMGYGILALLASLFIAVLYLPGSPSALIWPEEWIIVIIWVALGSIGFLQGRTERL